MKQLRKKFLVSGLCAFGLFVGCSDSVEQVKPTSAEVQAIQFDANELQARLEKIIQWNGITGMALAVMHGGQPVHVEYFGLADINDNIPVTKDTLFQLSSSSKAFVGVAVMRLVESGRLSLDDTVGQYVENLPVDWAGIRIVDLITHNSGLPEILRCDLSDEDVARACVEEMPHEAAPRERHSYNQTNAYLVQKVVEALTDMRFPDAMQDLVFAPAGMTGAVYNGDSSADVPNRAQSYYPDGEGGHAPREYRFPVFLYAGAGLNSSLEDVMKFMGGVAGSSLLSQPSIDRMIEEPRLKNGEVSNYAIGWVVRRHANGTISAGHEGGFLTTVRMYPETNTSLILLTNGSNTRLQVEDIAVEIADVFMPGLLSGVERLIISMRDAYVESNADGAVAAYETFRSTSDNAAANTENAINSLGYLLLSKNLPQEALEVFRLNVRDYPESVNTHDSLGETLMLVGENDLAITAWETVLELDPGNERALEMLAQIRGDNSD